MARKTITAFLVASAPRASGETLFAVIPNDVMTAARESGQHLNRLVKEYFDTEYFGGDDSGVLADEIEITGPLYPLALQKRVAFGGKAPE